MVAGLSIENKQWMVKNWKNTWKFLTIFLQNTCNKTFRLKREIFNSCFMYLHKKIVEISASQNYVKNTYAVRILKKAVLYI